jgi:hypothetical protein
MKVTGQQLYQMFRAIQLNHGCEMDRWHDLDEVDAISWSDLAAELEEVSKRAGT